VGDISALPRRTLERAIGDAAGSHLYELARGIDDRPVITDGPAKSVGSENTFAHDLDAETDILRELLRLSDRTAGRLRAKGLCGRTITIKVRYSNFSTITRSRTLGAEIDTATEIYEVAKALALRLGLERARVRLLGVAVTGLMPGPPRRQLDLLESSSRPGARDVAHAVDSIRDRFGDASVKPAALLE
jgi:DNA polymerase-4